jgi:hypothetical protein
MSRITIIDDENCTLWCYPEKKMIQHEFHRFTHGEPFNNILIKGVEAFKKYRCDRWLSDDRKLNIVHPDNFNWGDKNWAPLILEAGWKYWALLMPTSTTGQMSSRRLIQYFSEKNVTVQVFEDVDLAMSWLEGQP